MANSSAADQCAAELTRLLGEQAEICAGIREFSRKQREFVEKRQEDDLLRLLSGKQRLIEKHESVSAASQKERERWEGLRDQASPEARAGAEAAWEKLRSVLTEIMDLEDASRSLLQSQQERATIDIGKIQRGKALNKAYGGGMKPPPPARYSDRQG